MVKETYISFETARLLKEKGFHELCHKAYHYYGYALSYHHKAKDFNGEKYSKLNTEWYSAPTQQMVMAWLREKDIYIEIRHSFAEYGDKPQYFGRIYSKDEEFDKKSACFLRMKNKYEDAVEDTIKYILTNLL